MDGKEPVNPQVGKHGCSQPCLALSIPGLLGAAPGAASLQLPISREAVSLRAPTLPSAMLLGCALLPPDLRFPLHRMSAVLLVSSLQWDGFLCSCCDKSLFSSPTYPGLIPLSAFFCFDTCIYVLISFSLLGPYCFSFLTQSSSAVKTGITNSTGLCQ